MNNLSPLGLITCFVFSLFLNGTSITTHPVSGNSAAYIVNQSKYTIFFKPESRRSNPGLDPNAAYPLKAGESYFLPFDAVSTPVMIGGKIYRLPTGARVVINSQGVPEPANLIAKAGVALPAYGTVESPCVNFAMLANSKHVLLQVPDVLARQ
jgi:hypothetical protein